MAEYSVTREGNIVATIRMSFTRRKGGKSRIVAPQPQADEYILPSLAKGFRWQRMLDEGVFGSCTELAAAEGCCPSYVARLTRLTALSPRIIRRLLDGTAPDSLRMMSMKNALPASWEEQERLFGIAP